MESQTTIARPGPPPASSPCLQARAPWREGTRRQDFAKLRRFHAQRIHGAWGQGHWSPLCYGSCIFQQTFHGSCKSRGGCTTTSRALLSHAFRAQENTSPAAGAGCKTRALVRLINCTVRDPSPPAMQQKCACVRVCVRVSARVCKGLVEKGVWECGGEWDEGVGSQKAVEGLAYGFPRARRVDDWTPGSDQGKKGVPASSGRPPSGRRSGGPSQALSTAQPLECLPRQ